MRKWTFLILAAAAIALVWYFARTYWRIPLPGSEPKWEQVTRGDIRVPITAAGLIEPAQRIDIKSEASGEVIEIRVQEGDRVSAGDILVLLKKDDEERNVDRAQAALDRAEAGLANAKVSVEKAKAQINFAKARVKELEAQSTSTEFELKKTEALQERDSKIYSDQELIDTRARHEIVLAQLEQARANAEIASNDFAVAQQNVKIQEATVREATKTLEEAQDRLDETVIRTRQDAIVTDVLVRAGMLVQSGTGGFSLGTPIMTLADIGSMKVVARVDEADYGKIHNISPIDALPEIEELREAARSSADTIERRTGQVKITVDAFPEDEFVGVIERVEPQGKLNAGAAVIQFDVHVRITDDRRYKLPLGAQAQVEFTVESVHDVLRVPADAVKTFESQRGVWVKVPAESPGDFWGKRFVPCRFGITDGTYTQLVAVTGGHTLEEGQAVYTRLPRNPSDRED